MKRTIYIALTAVLTVLASCQREVFPDMENVPDGYMKLNFSAAVPGMEEVQTRSVDIDGGGIQNMTLFCFDDYGLFISTETASLNPAGDLNGTIATTFDALVPDNTRRIHFLSNQNMTGYREGDFRNKSESEVMALLEGSSGRMIYWARFQYDPANEKKNFAEQLKAQNIPTSEAADGNTMRYANIVMLRNHAYVTIQNTENNTRYFTTTGFVVYNTPAYGTVAPYDKENNRFPTIAEWRASDYVTLPDNDAKMSNITGVNKATVISDEEVFGQFIFESENRLTDPVSVILRGLNEGETGEGKFYRVLLQDDQGNPIPVRRNHHYILNVSGKLKNGKDTFNEALDAPATNNIWVSIDPTIREVAGPIKVGDNYVNYILKVHQTAYVVTGDESDSKKQITVFYDLSRKDGTPLTTAEKPEISWVDASQDVANNKVDSFDDGAPLTADGKEWEAGSGKEKYNGHSVLTLNAMAGEPIRRGTLLVKFGLLQRTIEVVTVREQHFKPTWVSTQVFGSVDVDDKDSRAHVTVMFNVPKTTPKELFPMKVWISVNNLDLRSGAGEPLPIVKKGDSEYGGEDIGRYDPDGEISETNPAIGYKYVYEIEKPEDAGTQRVYFENILNEKDTDVDYVTIEADHFITVTKTATFSGEATYSIASDDKMKKTGATAEDGVNNIFSFDMDGLSGRPTDENIRYYLVPQKINAPVVFDLVLKEGRGTSATVQAPNPIAGVKDEFLFYSQYLAPYSSQDPNHCTFSTNIWDMDESGIARMFYVTSTGTGNKINVQFKTTQAKSAEVIRISSNQGLSQSGLADGNYAGREYRSFVFELANYRPFTFASQVGDNIMGKGETKATATLDYANVGYPVTIQFDVKSFMSDPQKGGNNPSMNVDPFGTEFEIYIDAPMLNSDLPKDANGRYIYTVPADGKLTNAADGRVSLNFFTNSIVSEGEIVISSNQDKVVFDTETFTVVNNPLVGRITYGRQAMPVPAGKFVAIERSRNNNRIASMTVSAPSTDGTNYSLRLRKEYEFSWSDSITIYYSADDGIKYSHTCALYELFRNPTINLAATAE